MTPDTRNALDLMLDVLEGIVEMLEKQASIDGAIEQGWGSQGNPFRGVESSMRRDTQKARSTIRAIRRGWVAEAPTREK